MKVSVYVSQKDEAKLRAVSGDPADWVRGLVKHALARLPEAPAEPPEDEVPVEA